MASTSEKISQDGARPERVSARVPHGGPNERSLNSDSVSFPVHPDDPDTLPEQVKRLAEDVKAVEQMVLDLGDSPTKTSLGSDDIPCHPERVCRPGVGVTTRERISTGTRLVGGLLMGEAKETKANDRGTRTIWPIQIFALEGGAYVGWLERLPDDAADDDVTIGKFRVA